MRDLEDQWIRIDCRKGDLIVLPEGIYHRFTLDGDDYIKVRGAGGGAGQGAAGGCRVQQDCSTVNPGQCEAGGGV